jgi:ABC-type protease/lipase transport system fused ATPase/permease subunit
VTKDDFESTTSVLARRAPGLAWLPAFLRQRLTPAALWGTIVGTIGVIVIAVTSWVNTQATIRRLDEATKESADDRRQVRELLQTIQTQQAVMGSKVDSIDKWRERIEDVAEAPPHARKRK